VEASETGRCVVTERWKDVFGWEGLYEVSNLGNVRSLDRIATFKIRSKVIQVAYKGRPRKRVIVDGYKCVGLCRDRQRQLRKVHQLVLEAFVGPRPAGHVARHLDGVRKNCELANLTWGTPLENSQDRIAHGRSPKGQKQHLAKLSDAKVRAIRRHVSRTGSRNGLASRYGVSRSTLYAASTGKTWAHVV